MREGRRGRKADGALRSLLTFEQLVLRDQAQREHRLALGVVGRLGQRLADERLGFGVATLVVEQVRPLERGVHRSR